MPHRHLEDRVYTVTSGAFYIGLRSVFDEELLLDYRPGADVVLPGGTVHFHWARSGTYVTPSVGRRAAGTRVHRPTDDPPKQ